MRKERGRVGELRLTIMAREIDTGISNALAGFFSWRRYKMSPALSTSYIGQSSIFERNLLVVGLADFAGSNFQRMVSWSSVVFLSDFGSTVRNRRLLHTTHPIPNQKNKTGTVGHPLQYTSTLQERPIPLCLSRRFTSSSLREQRTIFNILGRKHLPRC